MQSALDVLALDIATTTGWARGQVGMRPTSGSISFARYESASDNAIFGRALAWFSDFLRDEPRPQILIIEALLPPGAMEGATNKAARDRLAGLHGIFRGVAHLRGINDVAAVTVGDVRGHFIDDRTCKRVIAKRETIEKCRRLGWLAEDDNAADALACWSFACGLIEPETALQVSPLFNRDLRR